MRNKMTDLDNHLFEQLERLKDPDLSEDDFKKEIQRSKGMVDVASQIIESRKMQLDFVKMVGSGKYDPAFTNQLGWTEKKEE